MRNVPLERTSARSRASALALVKAQAATITINPAWLHTHPGDIDLVTHEAMHIVQGYPGYGDARVPGWLVEGIADYARDRYGMDNAAAGWVLPGKVEKGQNFDSGYRVTGAFLKWAEAEYPGLVLALAAVAVAQWWHGGSLLTLLDGPAFVIVVGGTWGAVILQTPRKYMLAALAQARWMLFPPGWRRQRTVSGLSATERRRSRPR